MSGRQHHLLLLGDRRRFIEFARPSKREPLETITDTLGAILTQPSPLVPALPLGYPIALLSTWAFLPLSTAILFVVAFVGFFVFTRQVNGDENDDEGDAPPMNLLAFLAAFASAGLLSPSGLEPTWSLMGAITTLIIAAASVTLNTSSIEKEEVIEPTSLDLQAMKDWDDRMEQTEQVEDLK